MRRGFTLIELLVATGVFLFGFTAAYAMFIAGTRARVQADGILRLSIASTSLLQEFKLEAGREDASVTSAAIPFAPEKYVGCGFANFPESAAPTSLADLQMYRYSLQPGIWYRVISCLDEKGDKTDRKATALQMDVLTLWNPVPDDTLTLQDLVTRQRIDKEAGWPTTGANLLDLQVQFVADHLAKRGMATRERAVIIRRASWER